MCLYVFSFTFPYFFFSFFSARMNSNCTIHAHGFIVQELHLVYCTSTFLVTLFFFFFVFQRVWIVTALFMHLDSLCKSQIALFTGPTTTLFRKNLLKTGITTLSTHLKIILLPCFHLQVFRKRSCIRMDPTNFENLTTDYIFFIFLKHMSNFVIIGYYLLYDA